MKKLFIAVLMLAMMLSLSACRSMKNTKSSVEPETHEMTLIDSTAGYTIYRHDETGVLYFCRDGGYGRSVCAMVNPDGTPYVR